MIDEPQTPGAGPEGTGQETSTGGSSDWSTVSPSQPATPPPAQSLEPLPPPPPPLPPSAPPQPGGSYQDVYGSQPQTPPAGGYTSAPGGGYTQPPPPPGYAGGPGPQYPPGAPPPAAGQGLSSNAAAAIAYITFIPAVIFLVVAPYNHDRFVRFHAWQSIALNVVGVAISVIFTLVAFIGFHLVWWTFHSLIDLALFVFWLIALIKASQGQWYKIPIVGDLAVSFAGNQV